MSLNHQLDEMYRGGMVGKWRWLMIPIVIIGMVLFVLSVLFPAEDFLKMKREGNIAFLSGGETRQK